MTGFIQKSIFEKHLTIDLWGAQMFKKQRLEKLTAL